MSGGWSESVQIAVRRLVARTGNSVFSRQQLIADELNRIVNETGSRGSTPEMTLSRELQQLRDKGELEFMEPGLYRLKAKTAQLPSANSSKCVFVSGSHSIYEDQPEKFYRFPKRLLKAATRALDQWVLYQEPRRAGQRGYFGAAIVEQIVVDPQNEEMFLALIHPGTFIEFGKDVPFNKDGTVVESGLLLSDGRVSGGLAVQSIRPISDEDFFRIVNMGMIEDSNVLPREDGDDEKVANEFFEDRIEWSGPSDRTTILVERKSRDRQFRKKVLGAYGQSCAFTGMQLINGGGRAEVQAAHIMSVEAGGPDTVANGLALSGTVHWMFDRGLISLSDSGAILLSKKINDLETVEKLILPNRQAELPANEKERPHPRYLAWHREYHQIAA